MSERVVHYCCICSKRFEPNPRLGDRQRTCGDTTAKSNDGVSTLEIGEPNIPKLTTPTTAGSADVIAAPIDATTGLHIPTLACTTPPTCDSGGPAAAWPLPA